MFYILEDICTEDIKGVIALVKFLLTVVRWVVPIILIVLGTIDLVKCVIAGKEDEIKNAQKMLIKRLVYAVVVFLVPMLVSWVMGLIGNTEWKECWTSTNASGSNIFNVSDPNNGVRSD